MFYKKIIITLLALFVISITWALENMITELPITSTELLLAPLSNPASIGFGNSEGIGWMQSIEKKKLSDNYYLFLNMKGISYNFENNKEFGSRHRFSHGFEISKSAMNNLYLGTSYDWYNNDYKKGNFLLGLLYRPVDFLSTGITLDNYRNEEPKYKFGCSVRPFAILPFFREHSLELFTDIEYINKDNNYEIKKPLVGLNSEIVDGFKINAGYNLEYDRVRLDFSICASKLQLGFANIKKEDNNKSDNSAYIFLPRKAFATVLTKNNAHFYSVPVKKEVVTYKAPKHQIGPIRIYDSNQIDVDSILEDIKKASLDNAIYGLLFVNWNFKSSLSIKQELLDELSAFKTQGKKIVFYYDNMSNWDYVFASAIADKIYLSPQGTIDLKGVSISSPYINDTLEKLGIEVLNFRSHEYKTAGNMFSESDMTAEERIEYSKIAESYYNLMCRLIESGRNDKLKKNVHALIDDGPYYIAEDALKFGLIDELIYQSQLEDKLKSDFGRKAIVNNLHEYLRYAWSKQKTQSVAVIYANGNIFMGKDGTSKNIGHLTLIDMIRKARNKKKYKGIILRIDSGGGSAQASDAINHEIELARIENKKPVVVSMSGVAASGGYYIASNADCIIANESTLTGSIGVIGITFNAEEMFKKIYMNWATVKKGKHADFGSWTRKWNDDEKVKLHDLIEHSYRTFVDKVSKGRNKKYSEIDSVAMGKIWTGKQAMELGLVDEIGGIKQAVNKLKTIAHIDGLVECVNINKSYKNRNIVFSTDSVYQTLLPKFPFNLFEEYVDLYERWTKFEQEKVLYILPHDLESYRF